MENYIRIRVSDEEKELWFKVSRDRGVSLSQFMREVMNAVCDNNGVITGDVVITNKGESVITGEDVVTNVLTDEDDELLELASSYDEDYSEVIEAIGRVESGDFQADADDIAQVNRLIEQEGLSYNRSKKMLWKQEGERWKLIYDFNK